MAEQWPSIIYGNFEEKQVWESSLPGIKGYYGFVINSGTIVLA